jgi:hypothetical protein
MDLFNLIYRGIVVDNKDPRDIGRVKIHIPGVYPDTDDDGQRHSHADLPWAIPALSLYNSGGDNSKESSRDTDYYNRCGSGGIYTVPEIGYKVFIFFEQGNPSHPVYFASNPSESDWLTQKMMGKDRINAKLEQIKVFKEKFTPVKGVDGTDGDGWADGAHVNARMGIEGSGEGTPFPIDGETPDEGLDNAKEGKSPIKLEGGGDKNVYSPFKRKFSNEDKNGEDYTRDPDREPIERVRGNTVGLDVKPLLDKELVEGKIDRSKEPHQYIDENDPIGGTGDSGEYDEKNDLYHINRQITTMTTKGGTTIIIDNRKGEENFYFVHKNYLFNVDEHGSVKEFCGQNDPEGGKREPTYNGESKKDGLKDDTDKEIRADKELGVAGMYKIHVLGNFITYTKGNAFMQIDKNMQVDVNDSYGVRVRKGDVDIIIEGEDDKVRKGKDDDLYESAKKDQHGDLNISVKKGNIEINCHKNANIHVGDQCNLRVDGDMKVHVRKSYHLFVEGDYNEFITGNKYSTFKGKVEEHYYKDVKQEYAKSVFRTIQQKDDCEANVHRLKGPLHVSSGKQKGDVRIQNDLHIIKNIRTKETSLRINKLQVGKPGTPGKILITGGDSANLVCQGNAKAKNFITSKVKLNGHKHKYKDRFGKRGQKSSQGTTKPPIQDGGNLNINPINSLIPQDPNPPESGKNKGAGEKVEFEKDEKSKKFRATDGPESKKSSPNKALPAKRRHKDRKEKTEIKSDVPAEKK